MSGRSTGSSRRGLAGATGGRWKSTFAAVVVAGLVVAGCTAEGDGIQQQGHFVVEVTSVDGNPPPTADQPLPPNLGFAEEEWIFTVRAVDGRGELNSSFNGFVRVGVEPGAVNRVLGGSADGRNLRLVGGVGDGTAVVTSVFGASRLWIQDLGYEPAPPGVLPGCANGADDDGDVLTDHPNDPGCAFADDMSEESGQLVSGVSRPVYYALPALADVQGRSAQTPYPAVAMRLATAPPHEVVVIRVSSDGFYLTDLYDAAAGYNHIFAYNYNTPEGMRVCDRVTYLSGTASEFYGFTELSFPSYELTYEVDPNAQTTPQNCPVPAPAVLDSATIDDPVEMEKLESGLVRIEGFVVASKFGPEPAHNNSFDANRSSCDLNRDGVVDYEDPLESSCSNACADDVACTEWTSYAARGNYKVHHPVERTYLLVNTSTALGFDPLGFKGATLPSLTGTLRNFSGGPLNWTIETRCIDDLVCGDPAVCPEVAAPPHEACVTLRTEIDNDSATY